MNIDNWQLGAALSDIVVAVAYPQVDLLSDGNPATRYAALGDLVGLGGDFAGRETPACSSGDFVVELSVAAHGHLHDGDANEVAILPHFSLATDRSCSDIQECILC